MSTTSTFPLVNFVPSAIPAAFIATPGPVMATPQMAASTPATPAMAPAAAAQKYRKAPDAPKRFKSAFIIFSAAKHREIKDAKAKEGKHEKTTDIAKLVSEAWRQLEPDEKSKWEAEAQKDKARYEVEKHMYKGPWKVLANKRAPKDPSAPKRPMSAFLSYSNKLRAALKKENPNATNSDLSKLLSVKWQSLDMKEKKKFVDEEFELRSKYKIEMAEWRERNAEEKRVERAEREAIALRTAEAQALARPAMEQAAALQQQALAAQQQQVNMAVAANLQQQMMAAGVQQQQQQQPTGQQEGTENGQPSDGQQQNGQTGNTASTGEEAQQGQNNQAAAANGMFNMNMGMQINPALLANNPFLAQQIQNQMQFQQLFGTLVVKNLI
ncbi:hypothetical protein MPSEU_000838500 [Mayamaea pseudoterrestris]|nr:hypothetical protein MPSEU_000838500 [Mayamaea pseudoterrestris]